MAELCEIQPVKQEEIPAVSRIAAEIWMEHYRCILSAGQIAYMLEQFQSPSAIEQQIAGGYQYFWLCYQGERAGYCSIHEEDGSLFLSKIYIQKDFRGKRIASCALRYLKGLCKERGLSKIWLTVNRHNANSIAVYGSLGFQKSREMVTDIGNGYVMDDYVMELNL